MIKAEKEYLKSKRENKEDLKSKVQQLEYDISVIKKALVNLTEKTTSTDPLAYLKHINSLSKNASCENNVKKELEEDTIELRLNLYEVGGYGFLTKYMLKDRIRMKRINDKGNDFFQLSINYSSDDEHSYICGLFGYNMGYEYEDKFTIEIHGLESKHYLNCERWLTALESILLFSSDDYKRVDFCVYISGTKPACTVAADITIYGKNGNIVDTVKIPSRLITSNFLMVWKQKDILLPYKK